VDDLSNSGPAVRLYREGRATGPPEDRYRRIEKSWRSIWLLFTTPTTTTRPQRTKRCPAISTRSTMSWWPLRGQQREVAAGAAQWQGAHHRRAVPRDQGATSAVFGCWKPL